MSEPDDKSDSGDEPADAKSKSVFDSDWSTLFGTPSTPSTPTFAPPKLGSAPSFKPPPVSPPSKPGGPAPAVQPPTLADPAAPPTEPKPEELEDGVVQAVLRRSSDKTEPVLMAKPKPTPEPKPERPASELAAPSTTPRTSEAGPAAGEYIAPKPRPEPKTPPRYEPPPGVTPDYEGADEDTEDRLPILPPSDDVGFDTQDDEDMQGAEPAADAPERKPSKPETKPEEAEEPDEPDEPDEPEQPAKVIPLAKVRQARAPSEPSKPRAREPEPERASEAGGGKLLLLLGAIAAVVLVVVFVKPGDDSGDDANDSGASRTEPSAAVDPREPAPATGEPGEPGTGEPGTETGEPGTETGEPGEPGTGEPEPGEPAPRPGNVDPRDPSLIPPGTPEANAKAFLKLPVSIHDGPPVGGIGSSGIHIDSVSTSRGRENTECDKPTSRFSIAVAKYVNVCFRVVHPREQEMLRVIWEKDGQVTRRGWVRIPDLHAYTTRAYLLLRPEYIGDWRVRIVPKGEEDIDLAVAEFVITE